MQKTLAHPSYISLENLSKIDDFSKLSKRQIVLTVTGRGNAIKNNTQTGNYFLFKLLVVKLTFKISIVLY